MATRFSVILEDFEGEVASIIEVVEASAHPNAVGRTRVAAVNASTLLLAATFEEFMREMARAYARLVVSTAGSYERLPQKLAPTLWRRSMEAIGKIDLDSRTEVFSRDSIFTNARTRFEVAYEFCKGDLTQDVYDDLIYNEHNMRAGAINALFNISGLSNVCGKTCDIDALQQLLGEPNQGRSQNALIGRLDEFFERRNQIAHSLNAMRSSGTGQLLVDAGLLVGLGRALCTTLDLLEFAVPKVVASS